MTRRLQRLWEKHESLGLLTYSLLPWVGQAPLALVASQVCSCPALLFSILNGSVCFLGEFQCVHMDVSVGGVYLLAASLSLHESGTR